MAGWSIFEQGSKVKCNGKSECNRLMDVCMSSSSDDDVNWGDCDDKLRSLFDQVLLMLLRGVYAKSGLRPIAALLGDGQPVDLFKLFCLVRDRGGFGSVSEDKLWGLIAEKFGFDYKLCASLKLIYFKYLDELDRWLNRITRDRVSANGSYECGGNLGLLSLELEQRFRDFATDGKALIVKDDEVQYDEICKHINVALKETFHLPEAETDSAMQDGVVTFVDGHGNISDIEDSTGKANHCALDISRKRKREFFAEMLRWMVKIAKNPYNPSIGRLSGGDREFWSVALSVRETRLHRKYTDSNYDQASSQQKKYKMHPSMYEDDISSAEGIRCSKRLSSFVKTPPCHCCKSDSDDQCHSKSHSISQPEKRIHLTEQVNTDLPVTKKFVSSIDDLSVKKCVPIGPDFQAEVPVWTGVVSESDSKWLGTPIWVPDTEKEDSQLQMELPRKGRPESCNCRFPGSVKCHRLHIAENRLKLRQKLGLAFYRWKFDRMGEEVCLSWLPDDEKKFKKIIRLYKPHLGRSFFPRKRRTDLVSYYYNVYLIKLRSYQNRVTPADVNSDDDETEFGSVGEAFGYSAVRVPKSESLICYQNEQDFSLV